jgi:hypothetical protein
LNAGTTPLLESALRLTSALNVETKAVGFWGGEGLVIE